MHSGNGMCKKRSSLLRHMRSMGVSQREGREQHFVYAKTGEVEAVLDTQKIKPVPKNMSRPSYPKSDEILLMRAANNAGSGGASSSYFP